MLGIVAATCSDLTGPTGLAPQAGGLVTVTYMGPPIRTNGVVQMTVKVFQVAPSYRVNPPPLVPNPNQ